MRRSPRYDTTKESKLRAGSRELPSTGQPNSGPGLIGDCSGGLFAGRIGAMIGLLRRSPGVLNPGGIKVRWIIRVIWILDGCGWKPARRLDGVGDAPPLITSARPRPPIPNPSPTTQVPPVRCNCKFSRKGRTIIWRWEGCWRRGGCRRRSPWSRKRSATTVIHGRPGPQPPQQAGRRIVLKPCRIC